MGKLDGKVAAITGGTRGFGLAIAHAYLREGAKVIVASRSTSSVEQAVAQLGADSSRVSGLACDVGDFTQVRALKGHALETFGQLDVWINNAGIAGPYGPTAHIAAEVFAAVLQTNIIGTYYGSWVAMQHFIQQNQGKLINILGDGSKRPRAMQNAYTTSKGWMKNFTQTLAKEYEDTEVGVYAFNPGMMITDLLTQVDVVEGYEDRLAVFGTIVSMFGNSPDVPAEKVVWLGSADTDGKTGLVVEQSSRFSMLGKVLKEGIRRLRGHTSKPVEVELHTIPSAFSLRNHNP